MWFCIELRSSLISPHQSSPFSEGSGEQSTPPSTCVQEDAYSHTSNDETAHQDTQDQRGVGAACLAPCRTCTELALKNISPRSPWFKSNPKGFLPQGKGASSPSDVSYVYSVPTPPAPRLLLLKVSILQVYPFAWNPPNSTQVHPRSHHTFRIVHSGVLLHILHTGVLQKFSQFEPSAIVGVELLQGVGDHPGGCLGPCHP